MADEFLKRVTDADRYGAEQDAAEKQAYQDMKKRLSAPGPKQAAPGSLPALPSGAAKSLFERVGSAPATPPVTHELVPDEKPADVPVGGTDDVSVNIRDNLAKLSTASDDLAPAEKQDFSSDLAQIRSWYTEAQGKLETRELVERMAQAFTQLGAGLWGSKHGVDMSGLKFDKANWDAKMDRLQEDFKVRLGELSERRRESAQERQFDTQQKLSKRGQDIDVAQSQNALELSKKTLGETIRHNQEMEKAALAKGQIDTGALSKMNSAVDKSMDKIRGVMVRAEVDDDRKLAHAKSVLIGDLGLTPEAADDLLTDKGLWDSDMDPDQAMGAVGLLGAKIKQNRLESLMGGVGAAGGTPAASAETKKYRNKATGQIMDLTEAQARAQGFPWPK